MLTIYIQHFTRAMMKLMFESTMLNAIRCNNSAFYFICQVFFFHDTFDTYFSYERWANWMKNNSVSGQTTSNENWANPFYNETNIMDNMVNPHLYRNIIGNEDFRIFFRTTFEHICSVCFFCSFYSMCQNFAIFMIGVEQIFHSIGFRQGGKIIVFITKCLSSFGLRIQSFHVISETVIRY